MASDLLEGLSPAQVEVVTTLAAPLAVVAGPGSGKTRVLTRRIAWRCRRGDADASHALVLTFSRRAASELVGRLRRLGLAAGSREAGVAAGTFHALAWAELSRHRADRGQAPPAVLARPRRLLGPALGTVLGRQPAPAETAALTTELAWARARGAGAGDYPALAASAGRRQLVTPETVVAAWGAYTRIKRSRGVWDLDDLLEACAGWLDTDEQAARAARWRYRHVFVDEYQDLNLAHRRLLRAWVGDRADLCIVGDPDQAVYGFNGAVPDLFERVGRDWPGIEVLALEDNFRSSPEIVRFAAALRPARSAPSAPSAPSAVGGGGGGRPPGPLPVVCSYADDGSEAAGVAAAIAARRAPGRSWSGMAVMARSNARLRQVAGSLDRVGVPWRLRDRRPLSEHPGVRAWIDALPATAPASDLVELLGTPAGATRETDRAAVIGAAADFRAALPRGTVGAFWAWLDAEGVTGEELGSDGVELATFHAAKGLEWPAVWVVGVEEGLVPLWSATSGAALAEEQRLLYVALTRAEEEVTVSWAGCRTTSGSMVPTRRSRWIDDLERAAATLSAQPPPDEQRSRLAGLLGGVRQLTADDVGAASRRRRALLSWRTERARAARVLPQVILPDPVVAALVRAAPRTAHDVVEVAAGAGRRVGGWAPELASVIAAAGRPDDAVA